MFHDNRSLLAALLFAAGLSFGRANGKERLDRYGDPLPRGAVTRLGTVRYRHGGNGSAFLPDGKTVVSVGQDNGIVFWDARSGRLLRTIETGTFSIGDKSAFAPAAGRLAVSGWLPLDPKFGWRNALAVFDTTTGKKLRLFERSQENGNPALALSPDGKYLFALGSNGKLRIAEVASGAELLRQQFPASSRASLTVSPDGSTLAVLTGKLFLWKWQTADEPRELKTSGRHGSALAFSPDGKRLATGNDFEARGAVLRLWDVASGRLLRQFAAPDRDISVYSHVAFAPDGKAVAVSANANRRYRVHLWDPSTGKFLKRLDFDRGRGPLAFSPNGTLLVVGARVWDFTRDKELSANNEAHRGAVASVAVGSGGLVVTAGADGTVRLWDAATGKQRRSLAHDSWVRAVALSPDGSRLAASNLKDTIYLWDTATGRKIYQLAGEGWLGGTPALAFTPDGKSLLSWSNMYLRRWDVRTGKAVLEHALRPSGLDIPTEKEERSNKLLILSVTLGEGCFTLDGKHFILQAGGSLFVFDSATGKELRKFPIDSGRVAALAVSPHGQLLASAWGKQLKIKLPGGRTLYTAPKKHPVTWWDLKTGRRCKQIFVPQQYAGPVAFAPNGRVFAVASSRPGASIRLVEVATGREVHKIEGFRSRVRSLAFLPDGKRLVSGMQDGSALIWNLKP